jgi:hypothetical protein
LPPVIEFRKSVDQVVSAAFKRDDRGVMSATHLAANERVGCLRELPDKLNGYCTGMSEFRIAAASSQLGSGDLKFSGNGAFDLGDSRVRQRSSLVGF